MRVIAVIKTGKYLANVDAIVANMMNPTTFGSELSEASVGGRLVTMSTTVDRLLAPRHFPTQGGSCSKAKYNVMISRNQSKGSQNRGSDIVHRTFKIRYIVRDLF
jgi:hypothetical protein